MTVTTSIAKSIIAILFKESIGIAMAITFATSNVIAIVTDFSSSTLKLGCLECRYSV
jgi:hypothetical protein